MDYGERGRKVVGAGFTLEAAKTRQKVAAEAGCCWTALWQRINKFAKVSS